MNIFQTQLLMADGRTQREHALRKGEPDEIPEDSPYGKSLSPQLAPRRVSAEEWFGTMRTKRKTK